MIISEPDARNLPFCFEAAILALYHPPESSLFFFNSSPDSNFPCQHEIWETCITSRSGGGGSFSKLIPEKMQEVSILVWSSHLGSTLQALYCWCKYWKVSDQGWNSPRRLWEVRTGLGDGPQLSNDRKLVHRPDGRATSCWKVANVSSWSQASCIPKRYLCWPGQASSVTGPAPAASRPAPSSRPSSTSLTSPRHPVPSFCSSLPPWPPTTNTRRDWRCSVR